MKKEKGKTYDKPKSQDEIDKEKKETDEFINARIETLKKAQSARAQTLEEALTEYETKKLKRNMSFVSDYLAVAALQRKILGVDGKDGDGEGKITVNFILKGADK